MIADWETATYLGFRLHLTSTDVTVYDGLRKLATVPSVKQARLVIKGYRRETRLNG